MIEFQWSKIDKKSNTPIIRDKEIDELAEILLNDYKPELLKEPRKIKSEHFIESYLGANLEYQYIYHDENEGRILGVSAFNKEKLKIFDREKLCVEEIILDKNSVVLDLYLTEEGREGLELFTGLHEAGHLWLHPKVYMEPSEQLSIFNSEAECLKPIKCCRRSDIESFGRRHKGYLTPEQWREHQANYFASAIAMPKTTFVQVALEILKSHGFNEGFVIEDAGSKELYFSKEKLPKSIAEVYGVSKSAAYVKLKKFGFIIDKKSLEEENKQCRMF